MAESKTFDLTLHERAALRRAYMPTLLRGGMFVPTTGAHAMGEAVRLRLRLPDPDMEVLEVAGRVAWLAPDTVVGPWTPGIGIHFDAGQEALRERIESLLGGMPNDEGQSPQAL